MKAVMVTEFGNPDVLLIKEVPTPSIGPNDVLIRVSAASVNFADIKARRGKYHGAGDPPFIPGLDVAGTVMEVGKNVSQIKKGERVIAFPKTGSYSEYTMADEVLTFKIPDEVTFELAAACPVVSVTTYNLLAKIARIKPGETVLIHSAAGGIGTTAIQMSKLLGASCIIGTVSSDHKMEVARKAGADIVINYNTTSVSGVIIEQTEGQGVDIILDSMAGPLFDENLKCLKRFGRLVNFGNALGEAGTLQTTDLHSSCRSVLGYSLGTHLKYKPESIRSTVEQVLDYLKNQQLSILVTKKFNLNEARKAHEWVESRKSVGKVLLIP